MTMERQKILMCAPDHYGVSYAINPWMDGQQGKIDKGLALKQWEALKEKIEEHADVVLIKSQPALPDMVYTANAALVWKKVAVVSRFHNKERQGEELHFKKWMEENGFTCADWPQDISFEGAGDALWDRRLPLLWIASGFRTDDRAAPLLEKIYGRRVVSLKLVDPRFYHLDTCLSCLPGGYIMYYPKAFAPESRALLEELVPAELHIKISEEDAAQFACNTVDLDKFVFMNGASEALQTQLRQVGFTPVLVPLSEFIKSGGAAKCLTLKLVRPFKE